MKTYNEYWNDPMFVLKRLHEQQNYMVQLAADTTLTDKRRKELMEGAEYQCDRFREQFHKLEGFDSAKLKEISDSIYQKIMNENKQ